MHYDTGLFHRINKNFDVRLSLYRIVVDNYIVANSGDIYHASSAYGYNMDQVSFKGVEAEFNATVFKKLSLFGNYTYRETDYDADDILASAVLLEISPKHKANFSARYGVFDKTLLTADIRYIGERKTEGDIYTMDDVILVDLGVEQKLFKNTTLHAYANNVFGEKYQEVYGYPLPEHIFGVNVKMTFF